MKDVEREAEGWARGPLDPALLRDELLHELFEHQADLHGPRPALVVDGEETTYADLDRRANRLARHLRATGVQTGDRVALLLPRGGDVFVALLAALKAGAAYVPLDPEYPADRINYILSDCSVHTLLTTSELAVEHPGAAEGSAGAARERNVVLLDAHAPEIAARGAGRLTRAQTGARPHDLCYVIYTSGSTGRPKGVQIEHRSAAHLVRAEAQLFAVTPIDRVYQGFSIAFDASVEEVWLALANGAALVVGTRDVVRSGPALSKWLAGARVTVLSCVPTLLSMMDAGDQGDRGVPNLRLLIVGGESCPQDLVRRWSRPGLRMVNTYGPTEATVIATAGDLLPDQPVTIGKPIANYRVYLLDTDLRPVGRGETGELFIGGPGVARGYVGRPDLDAQRFVPDPFSRNPSARLYRTGDLGAWTDDRQIEFRGRCDSQVKLRGFRIELSEIESALMHCPDVLSAAVTVRDDVPGAPGVPQLVAYLVSRDGKPIEPDVVRRHARSRLPAYMVPSILETVRELPTLPSGKVDRKQLPRPAGAAESAEAPAVPAVPDDLPERLGRYASPLLAACRQLFAPAPVGLRDDFFLDLGGHSLLAARLVSQLRADPRFSGLSVTDVYNHPTVEGLALELEARARESAAAGPSAPAALSPAPRPASPAARRRAFALCGLAQLPGLYLLLGFASLQWLVPFLVYGAVVDGGASVPSALGVSLAALLALYPVMLALPVAAKWLLLGRIRAGSYPLWGWYYLRWWFVHQLLAMAPTGSLVGTPLLAPYLRLLGAKIGRGVHLGTDNFGAFDLLNIGEGSSIGYDASLLGYTVSGDRLHVGPVTVGDHCFVGARSVLSPGATMEDGSALGDLALLPQGATVPRGESWVGSPARPRALHADEPAVAASTTPRSPAAFPLLSALVHAAGVFLLPAVYLLAIFPGVLVLYRAGQTWGEAGALLAAPMAAVCFILSLCLLIALSKWAVLGRVRAGRYRVAGGFYLRKWFVDQLMETSLDVLGPLYATLYLTPWYRLLGVTLGKDAEISTACAVSPDLLCVEEGSFIADNACVGAPHVRDGVMTLAPTRIGRRSFVGNSALLPPGATVGDNSLVGVLSTTPLTGPGAAEADTSWLGSPALFLPQRQCSTAFPQQQTYRPTFAKRCQRLVIEFFRVTLPATVVIVLSTLLIDAAVALRSRVSLAALVALYPLLLAACGLAAAAFVVAAKWVLMGRYRPGEQPLWSTFVWRTELLTALHEHLADPMLVELLTGTPFVCWFFRLLGARIGTRVYMETTSLTEFDLIDIGDDAALNCDATVQTHLFEDRVMKMSAIRIGDRCSVGTASVVLYDSAMESGSSLGDLSLLMKGETLPADTAWVGTPAKRGRGEDDKVTR